MSYLEKITTTTNQARQLGYSDDPAPRLGDWVKLHRPDWEAEWSHSGVVVAIAPKSKKLTIAYGELNAGPASRVMSGVPIDPAIIAELWRLDGQEWRRVI